MQSIRRLYALLRPYRGLILINMLCNVLVAIFTIVSIPLFIPFIRLIFGLDSQMSPGFSEKGGVFSIFDNLKFSVSEFIANHSREEALMLVCIIIVSTFFFKNLFRYLSLFFLAPVRNNVVRDLRSRLFSKYLLLPLSYYHQRKRGDLISRYSSDITEVEWSILNVIDVLIRQPLVIIGSLAFMTFINPMLTFAVLGLLVVTAIVIGGLGKSLRSTSSQAQTELGKLIARLEETLGGLKIIQAFNAQDLILKAFEKENNSYKDKITRILWRRDLASPLSEFLGVMVFGVLLWVGAKIVFAGQLSPETFFAFLIAFFYIIEPAKSFANAHFILNKGLAALDRIEEVIDEKKNIFLSKDPIVKSEFSNYIDFKNLSFSYENGDKPALRDINLRIEKGIRTAFVGASGSGKSTLLDILMRFYDPTTGSIEMDGVDIKNLDIKAYRAMFGVVTQDPILFHDTIENNLRLGNPNATHEEILHATTLSHSEQFIATKGLKLNTVLGDQGVTLSGGERQRLAIARAILGDPPILLFDEATSSLDAESEAFIQHAFTSLLEGKTAIIIAHRFSTIQHCDKIVVFKEGSIIEMGSHDELIQKDGEYRKFASFQLV